MIWKFLYSYRVIVVWLFYFLISMLLCKWFSIDHTVGLLAILLFNQLRLLRKLDKQ